ncbi:MAG: hypothetical protein ACRC3Z_03515 [Phocaeicola sp.]
MNNRWVNSAVRPICTILSLFLILFYTSLTLSAQSPDKRSWKQRLEKKKREQLNGNASERLWSEMGMVNKRGVLLCATTQQELSFDAIKDRFSGRTSALITSSTKSVKCADMQREQLLYVRQLHEIVRTVAVPITGEVTESKLIVAKVAQEQLRVIDVWCANYKTDNEEERLHYQLLQRVAAQLEL